LVMFEVKLSSKSGKWHYFRDRLFKIKFLNRGIMKRFLLGSMAFSVAFGCNKVSEQEVVSTEEAVNSQSFFTVKPGIDTFLKIKVDESDDLNRGTGKCELSAKGKFFVKDISGPENNYYKVTLTKAIPGCKFSTGFVFADHIVSSEGESGFCQKSWEEAPIMDYTTFDAYNNRSYATSSQPESATLIGSKEHKNRTMCQRASVLKRCFEKAVNSSSEAAAKKFRNWANARRINPVLALMAKAEQETKLGILPDSCSGGSCNGIGIGQIITAIDRNGNSLSNGDPKWRGVTHNILTNLAYSVRVVAAKTDMSNSLWDLAFYYNGSPAHQNAYASNVVGFYGQLQKCGL